MSATETISPGYTGLDTWDDAAILDALGAGQERAVAAAREAQDALAKAADAIAGRVGETGRIIYVGAGSSGVIAALDGMELFGTFGWPEGRVAFVLASGDRIAPFTGAPEDDPANGVAAISRVAPGPDDVVVAVSASGSTPFTLSATGAARSAGALTIGLACNADAPLLSLVEVPVFLDSGPEVVVGSTRMAAGTAQKAALGMISTLAMIRLGRVHDGMMIDLKVDNAKLRKRAVAMLAEMTGCSEREAADALDRSDGHVKTAALVARGLTPAEARACLAKTGGYLRSALAALG